MRMIRSLIPAILLIMAVSAHSIVFAAATPTTVTELMDVLTEEKISSLYNIDLNAPFSKEASGVRESISPETGELTLYSELLNIPGRNGMDLSLNLIYKSRDAKVLEERTICANTANSYGQTIIAYYDVYDANGFWLRTDALQYTTADPTILASVTMGTETWTFTGNLQYASGTALITAANIANFAGAKSLVNESRYVFGEGWSLDMPSLMIDGDNVYVTLDNGQTYEAEIGIGAGLKDYELTRAVFTEDTTFTVNGKVSAYKLFYSTGESYYYAADGLLMRQEDRFGNAITYGWEVIDGRNLLTKVIDTVGRTAILTYSDQSIEIRFGDRKVSLSKELVPGQTDQYYLSSLTDPVGRQYRYSYTFDTADFDALGKTAATNTYTNLIKVTYPSGLSSVYSYEKSRKNLGLSGYMEYYKVGSRKDQAADKTFEEYTYIYSGEPDGFPDYKADSIDPAYQYAAKEVRSDGLITAYLFNFKHQMFSKEVSADRVYSTVETAYSESENLPVEIRTTTYNEAGSAAINEKTYVFDDRGNLIEQNYIDDQTAPDSESSKTSYSYDPEYDLLTSKSYNQDEKTKIREDYILSDDKKSVAESKIFANDGLMRWLKYKTDSFGNTISQSISLSEGEWNTTEFDYDSDFGGAYLTKATAKAVGNADGSKSDITESTNYDFMTGLVLTRTDGNGNMTRFSYDACGRLLEQTAADGTLSSLKYDDVRNAITATDAQGNSLYYDYSLSGRLRTVMDEVTGAVVGKITYNDRGQPVMTFDANGNCRLMEYDLTGRILSVKIRDSQDKLLSDQRAAYDEAATDSEGNPGYRISLTQMGDTQDLTTNYYFDSRERLIAQEKPYEGQVQRAEFSYDLLGNQISQTNFEGETSLSEYNVFGNILKTTDPSGISSTFDYDSAGNCTASSDGLGNTIRAVYDEAGRPILKILPYSETGTSETRLYYDNSGNLIKSIDPEGAVIKRAYSETGKLTSVEHVTGPGASIITRMEYDAAGNMLRLIQGMDSWQDTDVSVTNYTYDRFGRMLTEADPAGKVTRYAYDNNGNLTNKVDRNAVATVYSYDGLNRPTQIRNSKDGEAGRITYSYNLAGSRTGMQDETGETLYIYDEWNRLSLINYGTGIEEHYGYDLADRLTAFTLNQGSAAEIELKYDYDPAGRVSTVSDGGVRMESAYDTAGRLILENNGFTGISTNYSYDPMGNLESLKSFNGETLLDSYSYSYDKRGNQTQKIENGKSTAYYYDPLSRIKTVESEGGDVIQYDYTDLGNIASSAVIGPGGIAETLYSYDQANRLNLMETTERSEVTSKTFTYDPEGNQTFRSSLISRDGRTITSSEQQLLYNGLNRLDTVIDQDTGIASYLYNGDGLRTSRDFNGDITRYVYDRGNIVLETDGDYRITATNVRDSRQLNYRETGESTYFYQFNGHGDVTKLLDLSGSTIKDYSYDPYGNESFSLTPSFGGNISTTLWQAEESTIDNPFRYCGEYLDLSSGFYYLRARDYDPATQRFLTEDSYSGQTSEPLSLNLYSYCQGNPIRYIDPSGYMQIQGMFTDEHTQDTGISVTVDIDGKTKIAKLINGVTYMDNSGTRPPEGAIVHTPSGDYIVKNGMGCVYNHITSGGFYSSGFEPMNAELNLNDKQVEIQIVNGEAGIGKVNGDYGFGGWELTGPEVSANISTDFGLVEQDVSVYAEVHTASVTMYGNIPYFNVQIGATMSVLTAGGGFTFEDGIVKIGWHPIRIGGDVFIQEK